ncbi:MAG: hypothetical protein P8N14_01075, partial [Sulfitobacter sp.]|nr:hypothetical protein [Sulfitobacter sp.]
MGWINRRITTVVMLSLLLAACATPRGAGFQREVLAASEEKAANGDPIYNFSVFPVTRDVLPTLAAWPVTGVGSYRWINRQAQPA